MLDWLWYNGRIGLRALWRAGVKLTFDGGLAIASNVALSLLLSLFPFLMLIASLVRFFGGADLTEDIVSIVLDHWPEGSADQITQAIERAIANDGSSFFSWTTIVALVLASNGVENARDGLNRAYKVPETRGFVWRRVQALIVVAIGAVGLIGTAITLIGIPLVWDYVQARFPFDLGPLYTTLFALAQYGGAAAILFVILWAFHRYLPDGERRSRRKTPGIVLTIVGVIVGSELFALYLGYNANYSALYAGLAGIMIAIFYLYIVATLLLYGAEFNTALDELRLEREHAREAEKRRRKGRRRNPFKRQSADA